LFHGLKYPLYLPSLEVEIRDILYLVSFKEIFRKRFQSTHDMDRRSISSILLHMHVEYVLLSWKCDRMDSHRKITQMACLLCPSINPYTISFGSYDE
jgi:hypothetical protein